MQVKGRVRNDPHRWCLGLAEGDDGRQEFALWEFPSAIACAGLPLLRFLVPRLRWYVAKNMMKN